MRVAISALLIVCFVLSIFVVVVACKKSLQRRKERQDLINEVRMLRNAFVLVANEVKLQEDAGYSDVKAFSDLLNDYKELRP